MRSRTTLLAAFAIVLIAVAVAYVSFSNSGPNTSTPKDGVRLVTNYGNITIVLYDDMPITTGNFKKLAGQGVYNGTIFHRVVAGFVIQGGDPNQTGHGDLNIPAIPDEFTDHNRNDRGTVAMANAGPNTGSSQFFVNLVNNNYLDTKHPVFGKVTDDSMYVVENIAEVKTYKDDPQYQNLQESDPLYYRPLSNVTIFVAELIKI
jgi:peptidylprolyl isomerase